MATRIKHVSNAFLGFKIPAVLRHGVNVWDVGIASSLPFSGGLSMYLGTFLITPSINLVMVWLAWLKT